MAIDSAEKRKSVTGISFYANFAIEPDATQPVAWRQTAGFGYYGIAATAPAATPPTDDDTKDAAGDTLTFTDFIDKDGAYLRAARITIGTAPGSARNADLGNWDRTDPDRHEVQSERIGRENRVGITHRIKSFSSRAGDAYAPTRIVVDYDELAPLARIPAANTTNRTDIDGAVMVPAIWRMFHAVESQLNSDLIVGPGTRQDTVFVQYDFDPSGSHGDKLRVLIQHDGRAGNVGAPLLLHVEYEEKGPNPLRAKDI